MDIKTIILNHIKTPGFQKRWRNIYWPLIKRFALYIYNRPLAAYHASKIRNTGEVDEIPESASASKIAHNRIADMYRAIERVPYEDAIEMAKKVAPEVQHEQGRVGTCVSWANVNMARVYLRSIYGHSPELAHMDIYMDRKTKMLDNGMYPDNANDMICERGIALYMDGVVPHCFESNCLKQVVREKYPHKKIQPIRIKIAKSYKSFYASSFDALYYYMAQDFKKYGPRAHQISIRSYQGWWSGEWPKATGKILGGHRIAVLNVPTETAFNKEPLLLVYDSAYNKAYVWSNGIEGLKHLTRKEAKKLLSSFSVYQFIFDHVKKTIPEKYRPLVYTTVKYGERGATVKLLQDFLMWQGYDIPAGKTGYFGRQTQKALSEWQTVELGKDHGGNYWGPISQRKLAEMFAG